MPTVPMSTAQAQPSAPSVPQALGLIAAAEMDKMGRVPKPTIDQPVPKNA